MFLGVRFTGFLLLSLVPLLLQSQANTLIMGKVTNARTVKEIELSMNTQYLDNEHEVYFSNILADYTFAFAVEVKAPQLAILEYANNQAFIYLEPNDTVYIDTDAYSFQYSLSFSGKGGANNTFLAEYLKEHPREMSPFSMVQYRKGIHWFSNSPRMDNVMLDNAPNVFDRKMKLRKEGALSKLQFFSATPTNSLSQLFRQFMEAEIIYDWAYHTLLYGMVYKNKYGLTDQYLDICGEVSLQHEQLGSYYYRKFLMGWINYQYMKAGEPGNPYIEQYDLGSQMLEGKPEAFFQSEMIVQALRGKNPEKIIPQYIEFSKENVYIPFEEKVISVYNKTMRYSTGADAPSFNLPNTMGQTVSLENYKGKPVYLNFWASWCRPCLAKMGRLKRIEPELEASGVQVLNISVDSDETNWKNLIAERNLPGEHVLAPLGIKSKVAFDYGVRVLPHYFIVDSSGRFARKPEGKTMEELKKTLLSLSE